MGKLLRNFLHHRHTSLDKILIFNQQIKYFVVTIAKKSKMWKIISILLFSVALLLIADSGNAMAPICGNCCNLERINLHCDPKCPAGTCIDKLRCENPSGDLCYDLEMDLMD